MRIPVRFALLAAAVLGLAAASSSCTSSGPSGVYADIIWRIRCEEMRGCSGYMDRDVNGYNGQGGHRVSCSVNESATSRTLSFSAYSASYGLILSNASFPRAGGTPNGTGCTVQVQEDNFYVGACGGADPSATQPCRVSGVQFTTDMEGRSLIRGNIYCRGLSPDAAPTIDRELTAPGNDPAAATMPLTFSIYDCAGYNPD